MSDPSAQAPVHSPPPATETDYLRTLLHLGQILNVSLDLDQQGVMAICAETDFVPSLSIAEIGATLKQPG